MVNLIDSHSLYNSLSEASFSENVLSPIEENRQFTLNTVVNNVLRNSNFIRGNIKIDELVTEIDVNNRIQSYIISTTTPFSFIYQNNRLYFIPLISNKKSGKIVTRIGKFISPEQIDPILSCKISPDNLQIFLQNNPCNVLTKSWSDMNIPNISRVHINGLNMEGTPDYNRYENHGQPYTMKVKLKHNNWSLLINVNAVVTFYQKRTQEEIEEFLIEKVLNLCN